MPSMPFVSPLSPGIRRRQTRRADLAANVPDDVKHAMRADDRSMFEGEDTLLSDLQKFPFPFASQTFLRRYRVQLGMA